MIILLLFYLCNSATIGELHLLTNSSVYFNDAKCLDGSAPGYYLAKGFGDGINKWLIYFSGGAWCVSIKDCYSRSKTMLGSTNVWWPRPFYDISEWGNSPGIPGGYFSENKTINPLIWNWNKVFLIYCDGGSFSGNNFTKTIYNNTEIFFRGFLNLQSYHNDLVENHNFGNATDVVISGSSAGGLSTFLHLDWWKSQVSENTKIIGLPENGFFPDYDKMTFSKTMRWVFDQMNCTLGVNQKCIEFSPRQSDCFFAEYTVPFLSTPVFVIQSRFDSWQIAVELGVKADNIDEINQYGDWFFNLFTTNVLADHKNGIFLDSCYHHSTTWNILIDDTNVGNALKTFYVDGYPNIFIQYRPYSCLECCY